MENNRLRNLHLANLDEHQMYNRVFDDHKDALRVSIIDGLELKVENLSIPEFKFPEQAPIVIKEIEVKEIRVPEIIREIQIERVEIPVVTKEIQIVQIEKPIIVPEIRIIEIEKPVIVKETVIQIVEQKVYEIPKIAKICMIVQALALIGLVVTNLIK